MENSPPFILCHLTFLVPLGLDVDGIYRVSGNLAVIQKLRHKADHGNEVSESYIEEMREATKSDAEKINLVFH